MSYAPDGEASYEKSTAGHLKAMQVRARLIDTRVPKAPDAVVLVLHGGASRQQGMMVSPTQLSVVRMIPIAKRIARDGGGRLAVFRLLNSVRGWDTQHTPVDDVSWALEQLQERLGDRPIALVGHSLGGRAALLSAAQPKVKTVVALAPWVYPTDGVPGIHGRRILIVHGSADRIAKPDKSAAVARNLAKTTDVSYVTVRGGKHAMLRRRNLFDGLASDFVTGTLLGKPQRGVAGRVLSGESWIEA
jgi:pimeloyl-ACP methyl ester carboxylesterase